MKARASTTAVGASTPASRARSSSSSGSRASAAHPLDEGEQLGRPRAASAPHRAACRAAAPRPGARRAAAPTRPRRRTSRRSALGGRPRGAARSCRCGSWCSWVCRTASTFHEGFESTMGTSHWTRRVHHVDSCRGRRPLAAATTHQVAHCRGRGREWPCEDDAMSTGTLVLAATPIGDPRDAAPRLAQELATADVVAAEDTRRLRRLLTDLAVTPTGSVVSYHEHNEAARTPDLVEPPRRGGARRRRHRRRYAVRLRPRLPPRRRCGRGRRTRDRACPGRAPSSWRWPSRGCRSTGSASTASSRASRGSAPRSSPRSPRSGAPSSSSRRRTGWPRRSRRCGTPSGPTVGPPCAAS